MQRVSLEKAMAQIESGQNIFIHTAAMAPSYLIQALVQTIDERQLQKIKIYHLHTEGPAPYVDAKYADQIEVNCLFVGGNVRAAVQSGRASYIPVFLSEMPRLFRSGVIPLDVALVQISPFDKNGMTSLGLSVDVSATAVHCAKIVIAQENKFVPRVFGDGILQEEHVHYVVSHDSPLYSCVSLEGEERVKKIGKNVADLVEDGSTLQMGIGDIPNAVLANLKNHRHLGIHTEMFSDGLIPLIESGVVTGQFKKIHPFKVVSSFAMGSEDLYRYIDDNPFFLFMGADFVNDPRVIQKNPKVCAINSAIEIDLTGQVCADSIGSKIYSGVGGQVDFMRGSALSHGGRPIIAIPSITAKGKGKIVSALSKGAGVTTSRSHVHYVVTEHGVAHLFGKSIKERAKALIAIADPSQRETLMREAHELCLL